MIFQVESKLGRSLENIFAIAYGDSYTCLLEVAGTTTEVRVGDRLLVPIIEEMPTRA